MELTKKQVVAAEEALIAAMRRNDAEALDPMLHDALIFHTPDGQRVTKAMDLDAHRSGGMVVHTFEVRERHVEIVGDTAVLSFHLNGSASVFGQPMDGQFRYLRVWKWLDRRLQVIGGSFIRIE
ncbi:nuclear transport factor 2 family protein [Catalinimonas alkaloidigena]|nr:nuclear transport factor 2 family protein [Catalinimonas alkaloidigena]